MALYPNSLNPPARQWHSNAAPWMNKASSITDAITGEDYKSLLTLSGTNVTSWTEEKGGLNGGVTATNWVQGGYAGRNLGCIQFGAVGGAGAGFATFDPIGALIAGTAKPFTVLLSAQLQVAPIGAGAHYLLSFGSSAAANPFIGFSLNTTTTDLILQRRNDAGVVVNGGTWTLGTDPFVLGVRYTGTTMTSRINRVTKDNAIAWGGGALTTNRLTLGALRLNAAASGISNMTFDRFIIVGGLAMSDAEYLPYESYLLRRIGL